MALAPVRFEHPPVIEVVCGVVFNPQKLPLQTPHIGLLWSDLRDEYPVVSENPPITQTVEVFGASAFGIMPEIQFGVIPPLRRTWFSSLDGRRVIQVQDNSLYFNWKRAEDDDHYPSYSKIIAQFKEILSTFNTFAVKEQIGTIEYRQFELSYVNHIIPEDGDDPDCGDALVDHVHRDVDSRFLPRPENINWITTYAFPGSEGRLRVTAATSQRIHDQKRILRLDLSARGLSTEGTDTGMFGWFDLAHDWITHGFVDVTSAKYQKRWGRQS